MSDARKCDRCGAFYDKNMKASRAVFEYHPNSTSRTKNGGDMCPKCAAKFDKWWNKKQQKSKRSIYGIQPIDVV